MEKERELDLMEGSEVDVRVCEKLSRRRRRRRRRRFFVHASRSERMQNNAIGHSLPNQIQFCFQKLRGHWRPSRTLQQVNICSSNAVFFVADVQQLPVFRTLKSRVESRGLEVMMMR